MTVAGVDITLIDQSSYIPSGSSVFAGIAGAFKKGPLEPTLCTSQAQFLNWFAPEGKPKKGYCTAYQSALDYLADADALWVVRAYNTDNPPLYGGIVINSTVENSNTVLLNGISPIENSDGVIEPDFSFTSYTNGVLFISGANPGAWNNDIYITLTVNTTELPDAKNPIYDLNVYKSSTANEPIETFLVSRDESATDGYGNNIYIENVVNGNSNYIYVLDNIAVDASTQLVAQAFKLNPQAGSDGGDTISVGDHETAIKKLGNPDELPLQLLLDGGLADTTYATTLMELAGKERRGECFCVLSTPKNLEKNTENLISNHRNNISSTYTYLASMYAPHVKIYDRFNDCYGWVAPDGMAASKINAAIRDYGYNFPAAGYTRGTLDTALDVFNNYTSGDMKLFDKAQINPIINDTSRGIVIMGNSTLYPTNSDLQDQNNMLTINLQIKPGLREFLKDYLFDLNDELTRNIIVSKINLFMKDVKAQRGVSDFYVVCDKTNNSPNDVAQGILRIDLYVKMVKSIKYIKANIIATAQGLDFSEFTGA